MSLGVDPLEVCLTQIFNIQELDQWNQDMNLDPLCLTAEILDQQINATLN